MFSLMWRTSSLSHDIEVALHISKWSTFQLPVLTRGFEPISMTFEVLSRLKEQLVRNL